MKIEIEILILIQIQTLISTYRDLSKSSILCNIYSISLFPIRITFKARDSPSSLFNLLPLLTYFNSNPNPSSSEQQQQQHFFCPFFLLCITFDFWIPALLQCLVWSLSYQKWNKNSIQKDTSFLFSLVYIFPFFFFRWIKISHPFFKLAISSFQMYLNATHEILLGT